MTVCGWLRCKVVLRDDDVMRVWSQMHGCDIVQHFFFSSWGKTTILLFFLNFFARFVSNFLSTQLLHLSLSRREVFVPLVSLICLTYSRFLT